MSQQVNMVSTQVEVIVKKHEVDSLTEKLENLDINDTKKDKHCRVLIGESGIW